MTYVIDNFIFSNEIELLELRYHMLKDYVDAFLLVEGNRTFKGDQKEFTADKCIKELGLPFDKFKILKVDLSSQDTSDPRVIRFRETTQRNAIRYYLDKIPEDTIFICTDVDEIFNPGIIEHSKKILLENPSVILKPNLDYLCESADRRLFNPDNTPFNWSEKAFICMKRHLDKNTVDEIRMNMSDIYGMYPGVNSFPWLIVNKIPEFYERAGWHFSWMGSERRQFEKLHTTSYLVDKIYYSTGLPETIETVRDNLPHRKIGLELKKYNRNWLPKKIFELPRVQTFLLPENEHYNSRGKSMLELRLNKYVEDTENPLNNFWLAYEYESIGQSAPAVSFYLRAAEKSTDIDLQYESLIRIAKCFDSQGSRKATTINLFQQAIGLKPDRPEAYFYLTKIYEWQQEWQLCYHYASIAYSVAKDQGIETLTDLGYPGIYAIMFQRCLGGWWIGKTEESRRLLQFIAKEYKDTMDKTYYDTVQNNLLRVGIGPESQGFKPYNKDKFDLLRWHFPGAEEIKENYSQVFQDLFVLCMLYGKREGTYLEIGSGKPFHGNNTALLEKDFDWKGIGLELNPKLVEEYRQARKNKILEVNALTVDYEELISEIAVNGVVDYLQVDCEPSKVTYEIMTKVPFDQFKFRVITYEHDHYVDMTGSFRKKSREFLKDKGYQLVVNDVSPDGQSTFEDWYVHPDLVDFTTLQIMTANDGKIKDIEKYFFHSESFNTEHR